MTQQLTERTIQGLHAALVPELPELPPSAAVLDIGCGTGAWLERLASQGFVHLHGIDLDISQFGSKRATCSQANLDYDDLGLGDRRFDLITAIEIVEHLENPGRLFLHVSEHLAPNGWFLMTTPNIQSVHARLRFLLNGKMKQFDDKGDSTHIYPVLIACLERILPRHDLRIARRFSYPPSGSPTSRPSVRLASRLLGLLLPDQYPGDIQCFLIQRNKGDRRAS